MSKEVIITLNEPASELNLLLSILLVLLNSSPQILSKDEKELTILVTDSTSDDFIKNVITQSIGAFVESVQIKS